MLPRHNAPDAQEIRDATTHWVRSDQGTQAVGLCHEGQMVRQSLHHVSTCHLIIAMMRLTEPHTQVEQYAIRRLLGIGQAKPLGAGKTRMDDVR